MISNIPTWSFKVVTSSQNKSKYIFIGLTVIGATVLNYGWITLIGLGIGYIFLLIYPIMSGKVQRHKPL